MNTTATLARFAATLEGRHIPSEVAHRGTIAIIDALGTVFAGLEETSVRLIRDQALREAGPGRARLFGLERTASPAAAALANGAAAHALDFDNISLTVSGFIASPTLFAALAVAESLDRPVSGQSLLEAFVAGWEVEAAVAAGLGVDHYSRGWHSTSTLGHFGAAVAASRVLGLSPAQMQSAIGIAASEASGLRTMVGNMTNPYHVGKAARNGVSAAMLAHSGFEAEPHVIEHSHGFAVAFNGKGNFDLNRMTADLGSRWDLVDPGLVVKMYPCCGLIHSGIDAALALREGLNLDDIERITVAVHALVPPTMKFDQPRTGYEAKFSTPFCIATAFLEGEVALDHFSDDRTRDSRWKTLMERISMQVHPDLTEPSSFLTREFTELHVHMGDGRTLSRRVWRMDNHGSRGRPVDFDDIGLKVERCVGAHPRRERILRALDIARTLPDLDDIRTMTEMLA
jgi:2-methylcitrate dehydratase PrpD